MKIAVCIKQVPISNSHIRIDSNSNWIRESIASFDFNEPDNYALEEALQINEKNPGEVVLISLGPDRVQNTIRNGLAKGADRAIHIKAEESHNLDPLMVASVFANRQANSKPMHL